jgi:hypothetical protein
MQVIDSTISLNVDRIKELNAIELKGDQLRERLHREKSKQDEEVKEQLVDNALDVALVESTIKNLRDVITESDYEYKEIQDAVIRFGFFLKKNSITPYNDATLAYFDYLVEEQKAKVQIAGGRDRLDNLLRYRQEHVQQVEVLSKNMKSGSTDELLDEAGVEDLVERLYRLKRFGENLRSIGNRTEAAHLGAYRERRYRPHWRCSSNSPASSNWLNSIR